MGTRISLDKTIGDGDSAFSVLVAAPSLGAERLDAIDPASIGLSVALARLALAELRVADYASWRIIKLKLGLDGRAPLAEDALTRLAPGGAGNHGKHRRRALGFVRKAETAFTETLERVRGEGWALIPKTNGRYARSRDGIVRRVAPGRGSYVGRPLLPNHHERKNGRHEFCTPRGQRVVAVARIEAEITLGAPPSPNRRSTAPS